MKMITWAEQHTLNFLKEWLEWAEGGAVTDLYFTGEGLCCSSYKYAAREGAGHLTVDYAMEEIFESQGKNIAFPFGRDDYWKRSKERTIHQCPKRLQWVKDTIAMLEDKCTTDWPEDYEVQL